MTLTPERISELNYDLKLGRLSGLRDAPDLLALLEEVEQLRAAAEPFAKLGQYILDEDLQTKPNDRAIWGFDRHELTYGDFRSIASIIGKATP